MTTIDDLNISISKLPPSEVHDLIMKIRSSRREKKVIKVITRKTSKAKPKPSLGSLMANLSDADRLDLIKELEGM